MKRAWWAVVLSGLSVSCGTSVLVRDLDDDDGAAGSGGAPTGGVGASAASSTGPSSSASVGSGGAGGECVPVSVEPEPLSGPIDLIVVAENTGFASSVVNPLLEQHLHPTLVTQLEQSGSDVQVIVLSDHGPLAHNLCFFPPLSSATTCNGPPGEVPGSFRQYSASVSFSQGLCAILSTLHGQTPDEFALAPNGWHPWLRTKALKVFLAAIGSGAFCSFDGEQYFDFNDPMQGQVSATQFDQKLLSLAPGQFGSSADRNYLFYTLLPIDPKPGDMPYLAAEPIKTSGCQTFEPTGSYQWLSKGTGAQRHSRCGNVPVALAQMGEDMAKRAVDRCRMRVPSQLAGQPTVELRFDAEPGPVTSFQQVPGELACGIESDKYYFEGDVIHLCPAACDLIEGGPGGTFTATWGCPLF